MPASAKANVLPASRSVGARAKAPIRRERARAPEEFKSSVLTIRVKEQLKVEATDILAEIGISLPEAVRVFLSRVVSEKGFPFRLEVPNAATRAAMEEARHLTGTFATAQELFDDLEKRRRAVNVPSSQGRPIARKSSSRIGTD